MAIYYAITTQNAQMLGWFIVTEAPTAEAALEAARNIIDPDGSVGLGERRATTSAPERGKISITALTADWQLF